MFSLLVEALLIPYWIFSVRASDYGLSSKLSEQPNLSQFTRLLNGFPALLDTLSAGNVTILAPTDDAFRAANITSNSSDMQALLSYHVLQGLHGGALLNGPPQYLPTILTDPAYSNVTGGQRVQVASNIFYSKNKAPSKIITADIIYAGGLIHIVDSVLAIPTFIRQAITDAGLTYLVSLLDESGYLGPAHVDLFSAIDAIQDVMAFLPNGPNLSPNISDAPKQTPQLRNSTFFYHLIENVVDYSTMLGNNSRLETALGEPVTITLRGRSIFVNAARVTGTDFLTCSGVFHVIDSLLDPRDPLARPQLPRFNVNPTHHLSTGAIAGIVVGATAAFMLTMIIIFFFYRRRQQMRKNQHQQSVPPTKPVGPLSRSSEPYKWRKPVELDAPYEVPCLSDDLNSTQRRELSPTTIRDDMDSPFGSVKIEGDIIESRPTFEGPANGRSNTRKDPDVSAQEISQVSWLNTSPDPHLKKLNKKPSLPFDKPLPSIKHEWR